MEFIEEERKQKSEIKQLEKRLSEFSQKADELRKELKEKEQEYRISTYKLNELRRTVKHNQLKPLKKESDADSNSENNPLNKHNLKKHNNIVKHLSNYYR